MKNAVSNKNRKKIVVWFSLFLLFASFVVLYQFFVWFEFQETLTVMAEETAALNMEIKDYTRGCRFQLEEENRHEMIRLLSTLKFRKFAIMQNTAISVADHAYRIEVWNDAFHCFMIVSGKESLNAIYDSDKVIPIEANSVLLYYLDVLSSENH